MTINISSGGLARPVDKLISILHYVDFSEVDAALLSSLKTEADLSAVVGLTSAGGISTDGISQSGTETGGSDNTNLLDWNGNVFDELSESATASEDQTITFALLEALSVNAMKLVYENVTASGDIDGLGSPSDKLFVIEFLIKGAKVREIFPHCVFQGRGEHTLQNEELEAREVTYAIKNNPTHGQFFRRVFI